VIIERYIIRNYIGPLIFSTSIITFVFIMDFILRYIDLFLGKGVDFFIVLQAFLLSLGHMFALIIPMAILPATLMAFGNLASENEITAMKSSGVSLYRMVLPAFYLALFLTGALILYNHYVLPESNHKLQNLLIDIARKKPAIELKENMFIDAFKGYTIYFQEKDDKTGQIKDIQIFKDVKKGSLPTTILAEKGKLAYLEDRHVLRFELENGEIHEMPVGDDPSTYRRTIFKNYTMNIEDIDRSLHRTERNYRGDREMNVSQMQEKIAGFWSDIELADSKMVETANRNLEEVFAYLDPVNRQNLLVRPARADSSTMKEQISRRLRESGDKPQLGRSSRSNRGYEIGQPAPLTRKLLESQLKIKDSHLRQIDRYRVEIHKKFSIPFACVVFVLLGSPIAIRMGRSGMNTAIGLSILFFLIYYICLIGGEKLADRRMVSPLFAMWGPNIFFGLSAFYLIRRSAQEKNLFNLSRLDPRGLFGR
jgi:lipopolysaccharide export system permease protein